LKIRGVALADGRESFEMREREERGERVGSAVLLYALLACVAAFLIGLAENIPGVGVPLFLAVLLAFWLL
jgi:hypothetical protein